MDEQAKHTPGEWLRVERTVYSLQSAGFRKGVEQFQNRWTFHVQGGPGATHEELDQVVQLAQASPDLLEALKGLLTALSDKRNGVVLEAMGSTIPLIALLDTDHAAPIISLARAAIEKATNNG